MESPFPSRPASEDQVSGSAVNYPFSAPDDITGLSPLALQVPSDAISPALRLDNEKQAIVDLNIAIIGAGPAGLTLARLLQKNDIPCLVYDAETDRHVRNQGGTFDLHSEAGQQALKEAGLFAEFKKHSRPEGQADKVVQRDGSVLRDDKMVEPFQRVDKHDRPEIDRETLRNILLDSVDSKTIRWNHKVRSANADPESNGKHIINFTNGTSASDIDLVVGAGGAWSKVRPLVTDIKPFCSGVTGVELWSLNVSTNNIWLSDYVGAGTCWMFDQDRAIMAQRNGNDSIRIYACVRQPEDWRDKCGINWSDHDAARQSLVEQHFSDCADDLKRMIIETRDELIIRPMYMLPVGISWTSQPGVTLMGDAAHLCTPFAGIGVNVAMADALTLARAVVARRDEILTSESRTSSISAAIQEYETAMFGYAMENAEKTWEGLQGHFSKDGSQRRAEKLREYYKAATGGEAV